MSTFEELFPKNTQPVNGPQAAVGAVGQVAPHVNRQTPTMPRIDEQELLKELGRKLDSKPALEKENILRLAAGDHRELVRKEKEYGGSWKKRGGVGAFMMAARKWDRIETQVERNGYDIFKTVQSNPSETGILDDIADLRRYLLLIEDHVRGVNQVEKERGK